MNTILCKYATNIYHLILSTVQSSFLLCSISDSPPCISNYNWCMFTVEMDLWGKQFKAIYELTGKKIKNKHKLLPIKKQVVSRTMTSVYKSVAASPKLTWMRSSETRIGSGSQGFWVMASKFLVPPIDIYALEF